MSWFDDHVLLILAGFLFAFIPLYPKLPLADLIPGYIVRLRLEDLFVGFTILVYGVQVFRKKAEWKTPFTWIVLAYAIIGVASTLSAVFITKTVPAEPLHVGKTLLHYFRYLEYFSLFFVGYSAVKTRNNLKFIFGIFAVTVVLISIYGYGQKYYYWPVYSTMNREFSKGMRLYLTEHARVQSTFGGHYDMAGYLVIALPVILALFFSTKNWKLKIPLIIVFTTGLWLLIMSASRTSFIGALVAILMVLLLFTMIQPGIIGKIRWGITRSLGIFFLLAFMFFTYGESIEERFVQTLNAYPPLMKTYDSVNDIRKKVVALNFVALAETFGFKMPEAKIPENAISTAELEEQIVVVPSDERPEPVRPADVKEDIPDIVYEATVSAEGVASVTAVEKERTYSENALKQGLSMAIRLDALWPRAIAGFQRNPLLGSGYATLTKAQIGEFTEAESTDNNFLRTLGETGLLGFITFYGTILIGFYFSFRIMFANVSVFTKAVAIGFVAASVGLLINAIFIDVFASSKIAFTYWALTGFFIAFFVRELSISRFSPKTPSKQVKTAVLPKSNQ